MDIKRKLKQATRTAVLKANYLLGNYDEVIWMIGDGRSGTTWVSDLINYDKRYREMFEPFHPKLIHDMDFIIPHQYMRQHESNKKLTALTSNILNGKFTNPRVDSENRRLLYSGLLIKDIFANLLCYWAVSQFPKTKPVLLIRNPFAVALSKYKKKSWFWATEPMDLLSQSALRKDYLLPFENEIERVSKENNYILNQVLVWSIINYVPLCQFEPGGIHIFFYENIYKNPRKEISKLIHFVRNEPASTSVTVPEDVVKRPSRVAGSESNILSGTSPVSSWMNELEPKLIDDGLKILQIFGFENLYDDMSMPNREALRKVHGSASYND
jgi:hypothetical protein